VSDLLGIGSSGLRAYRHALNAVGENVANAESLGYSRRSVTLRQTQASGGADLIFRQPILFNGVTAAGVTRAWDAFRAIEARYASAAAGRAEVRSQWLTGVEAALNDGAAGVGTSIGRFFDAGTTLAAAPNDRLGRSSMLLALGDVAAAFRNTAGALDRGNAGTARLPSSAGRNRRRPAAPRSSPI
jgi:flagellar hook-associated protein 1 FlgK